MRRSTLVLYTTLLLALCPALAAPADALVACVKAKKGQIKKNSEIELRKSCRKKERQLDLSALALEGRVCSEQDASDANALLEQVEIRFEVGLVPRSDVDAADLFALDTGLCARQITRDAYCKQAVALAENIVDWAEAAYERGLVTLAALIDSRRQLLTRRALCE